MLPKVYLTLCMVMFAISMAYSQKEDFEGTIDYHNTVSSKIPGINDKAMKLFLGLDNDLEVMIKHGNYLRRSGVCSEYYVPAVEKVYLKYIGIDTLYFIDYSSDTSKVTNINRTGEHKTIAGYDCLPITIQAGSSTYNYYYSPALHMNPEYDMNNSIGSFNIYAKETESIALESAVEAQNFKLVQLATSITARSIDDTVFSLPGLPQKKFSVDAILQSPEYPGGATGWQNYVRNNLNSSLAAKYVKVPKGESSASQTAMVGFIVTEQGNVTGVKILNADKVHPKLAAEAVRIISISHGWKPANVLGEKVRFYMSQPITFFVTKD